MKVDKGIKIWVQRPPVFDGKRQTGKYYTLGLWTHWEEPSGITFLGLLWWIKHGNQKPRDAVVAMLLQLDFCASKQSATDKKGNHTSWGWEADVCRKQSTKQAIFCPAAERQMHLSPPPSLHDPHCHHMERRHSNVHMQNRKQSWAGLQSE